MDNIKALLLPPLLSLRWVLKPASKAFTNKHHASFLSS